VNTVVRRHSKHSSLLAQSTIPALGSKVTAAGQSSDNNNQVNAVHISVCRMEVVDTVTATGQTGDTRPPEYFFSFR
jgi:hypothetical protein